ncbi:hypothetical protein L6R52_06170 [Myxococcota bacterium]|nr:hypothetical protein [Myxococcota bacterium]
MRTTMMAKLTWPIALGMALGVTACSDDGDKTDAGVADSGVHPDAAEAPVDGGDVADSGVHPDAAEDPRVTACKATIAAKEAQYAAELATWSIADAPEMVRADGNQNLEADYAGKYRDDLANHPGCEPRMMYAASGSEPFSLDNEATVPEGAALELTGFPCAAKDYVNANVDTTKPIVILVHGNSSGVTSFEEYFKQALAGTQIANFQGFQFMVDTMVRKQLATRLVEEGYEVIGFDARTDLVNTLGDYSADQRTGNPFRNIDHGWAVPMLQSLIKATIDANPGRKIALVGHSLGVTTIRDALRRLYVAHKAGAQGSVNPYAHVQDVVLLSGANHGVSSGALLCPNGAPLLPHMRSTVTCEMGDRDAFQPTYFSKPISGPGDLFSTPCADGEYAFGERGVCDGNVVGWTTMTMQDIAGGMLQDEFVSEASSKLDMPSCVDNELLTLADYDSSGYFFTGAPGFLANHFGTARSDAGIQKILDKLAD